MKRAYELTCIKYTRRLTLIKYYKITANGKTSYYTKYEELDGGFAKVMKNGKWGLLNPSGTVWGKIEFSKIYSKFHENMIRVEKNGKVGFADRETGRFIDCIFDAAEDFKDGVAWVNHNGQYRMINTVGKFTYKI